MSVHTAFCSLRRAPSDEAEIRGVTSSAAPEVSLLGISSSPSMEMLTPEIGVSSRLDTTVRPISDVARAVIARATALPRPRIS